jgi:hypothetical protein
MTKRRSPARVVTQAQMRRARAALEKDGLSFGGYHLRPDGSVDVLIENPAPPAPAPQADPGQAALEAWKKKHGRA